MRLRYIIHMETKLRKEALEELIEDIESPLFRYMRYWQEGRMSTQSFEQVVNELVEDKMEAIETRPVTPGYITDGDKDYT